MRRGYKEKPLYMCHTPRKDPLPFTGEDLVGLRVGPTLQARLQITGVVDKKDVVLHGTATYRSMIWIRVERVPGVGVHAITNYRALHGSK